MNKFDRFYSFSSCGKTKNIGPTQEEINECYKNSSTAVKIVGNGIQKWTVPYSGEYYIEAAGASGSGECQRYRQGRGARISAYFRLQRGTILYIVVGQQGEGPNQNWGGAGGGGSFIVQAVPHSDYLFTITTEYIVPLLIAGGGGGSGDCNYDTSNKIGGDAECTVGPYPGGYSIQNGASGGGGFLLDSQAKNAYGFLNGCKGGYHSSSYGKSYGGFGGGGSSNDAGGGGGGYIGGNSTSIGSNGSGGQSYSSQPILYCAPMHEGNGYVKIYHIKTCTCNSHSLALFSRLVVFLFIFVLKI